MEKKITDYLHLYLGCDLFVKAKEEGAKDNVFKLTAGKLNNWLEGGMWSRANAKLILRPISSITIDEWCEIQFKFSVDICESVHSPKLRYSDKPKHILVLENRLQTNTLTFNDGMVLLGMGFDLFGLIEPGLAIEATKEPA